MADKEEQTRKCGLIMPISAIDGLPESHWEEVRLIIKEALADTQFSVELVSDSNEIGIIQKRIVQNIYDNDIVICDVSAKNPNVMFELGMRLAFDKPAIIIKDDKTNYSFDTSPIEHINYPRDLHYPSIQVFKAKLKEKVLATFDASLKPGYTTFLKHFGQFVVANIEEKEVGKDEYLLAAVAELRAEVAGLGRAIRIREETPTKLGNIIFGSTATVSPSSDTYMAERDFALMFLAEQPSVESEQIENPHSPLYDKMLSEYIKRYVPDSIARKERHAETIRKKLFFETQKLVSRKAG